MNVPENLKYTKSHEWVLVDDNQVTVGITDFAQEQLGDLTFVELPAVGDSVNASDEIAVVESVKAASDVYAPVSGSIAAVNEELESSPELINSDAFGAGWIFKIDLGDPTELGTLLGAAEYQALAPSGD